MSKIKVELQTMQYKKLIHQLNEKAKNREFSVAKTSQATTLARTSASDRLRLLLDLHFMLREARKH